MLYLGLKCLLEMEGYNLENMTWEDVEKTPEVQNIILDSYVIWDNASVEVIAKVYGYEYGIKLSTNKLLDDWENYTL